MREGFVVSMVALIPPTTQLAGGAIAGIIIGVIIGVLLLIVPVVAVAIYCVR